MQVIYDLFLVGVVLISLGVFVGHEIAMRAYWRSRRKEEAE
jgi:hypothetical protein